MKKKSEGWVKVFKDCCRRACDEWQKGSSSLCPGDVPLVFEQELLATGDHASAAKRCVDFVENKSTGLGREEI